MRKERIRSFDPHRIKFNALVITNGEGKHIVDFNEIALSTGVIVPLTKEQVHSFQKPLKGEGYVISFEEEFMIQNISEQNLFHFLQLFHSPSIMIGKENLNQLTPYFRLLQNTREDLNDNLYTSMIYIKVNISRTF